MPKGAPQRKSQTTGVGYARGGITTPRPRGSTLKAGMPMNPITKMKRNNGIPGMNAGGKVKKGGC